MHTEGVAANGTIATQTLGFQPLISQSSPEQHARMLTMQSFQFQHTLGNSPLLSLQAIRDITKRLVDERRFEQIWFDSGLDKSGAKHVTADTGRDVLDALDNYSSRRAWLRLTRVDEIAPEFKEVVEQFYRDLSDFHKKDIKREVLKTFATLFVSSPSAITPYHIDHTWNYLLQISGEKTVHLFDPTDPQVLTQIEREDWYGEAASVAQKQGVSGIAYHLGPGDGVHHPVNAPHWVQNSSEVSISLSLGLCLHRSMRDAQVLQANYLLRRLGLNPGSNRNSEWSDSLKRLVIRAASKRSPNTFEQVLFSGVNRIRRITNMIGLSRFKPARKIEIT